MQLGELFFSLGFTSSGNSELKGFESAVEGSQSAVVMLSETMSKLIMLVEEMAVKMGAISRDELNHIKDLEREGRETRETAEAEKKSNSAKKDKMGILATLKSKMVDYFGSLAAGRLQLLGLTSALVAFTKKASDAAVHVDKISALTGLSTDSVQRLGDMATRTGGSLDDIAGAVSNFQKQSIDIQLGRGGNIGVFQFLGIDPHQDPLKILDQLAVKLKTMPKALGVNMARDLGLSDDLIYMLMNRDNLAPANPETFLTEVEVKRLKDFNFYFNRVFEQGKRVLQKFAAILAPIAERVVYFFDRIGLMFADLTNKMQPFMAEIQKYMPLVTVMAAILFAAFFPLQAALLAVALVMEDLWAFVRGDDSMLGRMLDWLSRITEQANLLKEVMAWLVSLIMPAGYEDMLAAGSQKPLTNLFGSTGSVMGDFEKTRKISERVNAGNNINNAPNITVNVNESKTPGETADAVSKRIVSDAYHQVNSARKER